MHCGLNLLIQNAFASVVMPLDVIPVKLESVRDVFPSKAPGLPACAASCFERRLLSRMHWQLESHVDIIQSITI